jgi:hypothetical protein
VGYDARITRRSSASNGPFVLFPAAERAGWFWPITPREGDVDQVRDPARFAGAKSLV